MMRKSYDYKNKKTRKFIMLTVPKAIDVPNGVEVEAKLVENGILL